MSWLEVGNKNVRRKRELRNWSLEGRLDSCQLDILEVDGSTIILVVEDSNTGWATYVGACIAEAYKQVDNVWLSQNLVLDAWPKS